MKIVALVSTQEIVGTIEYAETAYIISALTKDIARQLLNLVSKPYLRPYTIYQGDLSVWTRRQVYPGEERHYLTLGAVKDTREMFKEQGFIVVNHSDPLPIFPVQQEYQFPRSTSH